MGFEQTRGRDYMSESWSREADELLKRIESMKIVRTQAAPRESAAHTIGVQAPDVVLSVRQHPDGLLTAFVAELAAADEIAVSFWLVQDGNAEELWSEPVPSIKALAAEWLEDDEQSIAALHEREYELLFGEIAPF